MYIKHYFFKGITIYMKKEPVIKKIWLVIYTPLIYLGINFAVALCAMIAYTIFYMIGEMTASGDVPDISAALAAVQDFALVNAMALSLAAAVITLPILIVIFKSQNNKVDPRFKQKINAKGVMIGVLGSIGLHFALAEFMELTRIVEKYFPGYEAVSEAYTSGPFIFFVLYGLILAPVQEELLMRGIVMRRMWRYTNIWAAAVLSGALFGLLHGNLFQILYAFALSFFFALLYAKFKNIWVPVIAHITFNTGNIFQAVLNEFLPPAGGRLYVLIPAVMIAAVCIVLAATHEHAAPAPPA